jgi:hypothetical protein
MSQFPLGFTKCPKCQKFSINVTPTFGFSEQQIADWECPYCFLILEGENWQKNIVEELIEDIEKEQKSLLFGKILIHTPNEISPKKAKELAITYIKNIKIKGFPPSLENVRVLDCIEEWQIDFDKILPKGAIVIPKTYCLAVNKITGKTNPISLE